jgi:uncharacterized GH25 family protein
MASMRKAKQITPSRWIRKTLLYFSIVSVTCGWLAPTALAHDFWIEPDQFTPAAGSRVDVYLREGMGLKGNTLPYIEDWIQDFSEVTRGGRASVHSLQGNDPAATLTIGAGGTLLGYQSNGSFVELDAEKFLDYIAKEGLEFIRAERIQYGEDDQAALEYFVRCAKVLIQSGDPDDDVYAARMGYHLELVPEVNPYLLEPGAHLTFRLYAENQPAEGLLVQAFPKASPGRIQQVRTDAEGRATLTLDQPGIWLVKAVGIERSDDSAEANWLSYWASYLFELPAASLK